MIKDYTKELQSIREDETKAKRKHDQKIAKKVRSFFDFENLAQRSLGSHRQRLSTRKRAEFSDLFIQLIERSYLQRSKNLVGDYRLSYGDEKIAGNKATVACNIHKKTLDFEITYELHKVGRKWMINNIIFDQVNLVKNYQTQFNQIIARSDIDNLLSLMRKRLGEDTTEVDSAL